MMKEYEVTNVKATDDFRLILEFKDLDNEDNIEYRIFNAKEHFSNKKPPLSDVASDLDLFLNAHVIAGTVGWNEDIDIAVEFLYENSEML